MRRTRVFIALGLAALVAVGASALAIASSGSPGKPARRQFAADLAAQLGKPTDQVQAALEAVAHQPTLAQRAARLRRVAARLNARADALAKGVRPGRVGGQGAGRPWEAALAKQLGVSTAKLDAALRAVAAKRLQQGHVPPALLRHLAMIRGS
jgi:hypothetical protein